MAVYNNSKDFIKHGKKEKLQGFVKDKHNVSLIIDTLKPEIMEQIKLAIF
jgi:hypothetical protein